MKDREPNCSDHHQKGRGDICTPCLELMEVTDLILANLNDQL